MNSQRTRYQHLSRFIVTVVLAVFCCSKVMCQEQVVIKPHYVLVQISSESNRIKALEKAHAYKDLETVKKDAAGIKAAMIKDFKDRFTYCPVYFYIDTNLDLIKARKFDGVLFDTAGQLVANPPLKADSKDYLIAYWGLPTTQPGNMKVVKDSLTQYSKVGEPNGKGLIICNYKMQQLTYFCRLGLYEWMLDKKKQKGYFYISKRFNIQYFPMADRINSHVPYIYE